MIIELTVQNILAAVAVVWAFYKAVCWVLDRYQIGDKRKKLNLFMESNVVLMREVIRYAHKMTLEAGYIDEDELEHIENTYRIYHALGGNGTGDRWMQEIRQLPRKRESWPTSNQ